MRLFKSVEAIIPVSLIAANEYKLKQEILRRLVEDELASLPEIYQLIGNNPLQLMYDNHYYHAALMSTVFRINNYELLARILVLVYREYRGRGFQDHYFPVALHAWQTAIEKALTKESIYEIKRVYKWLIDHHDHVLNLAKSDHYHTFNYINIEGFNATFLMNLLEGDYKQCFLLVEQYFGEGKELARLYLQVIQPCLYEIGRLWEGGHISVAQEHLATAIVSRVMLTQSTRIDSNCCMGKAVIVCAEGELHELGGRMVADLLKKDGWQVDFFGASLPTTELVKYLQSCSPHLVGIAVSMPFHINSAREAIEAIHQHAVLCNLKIMVGGPAFQHEERSWRLINADAHAVDGESAVKIAKKWWSMKE